MTRSARFDLPLYLALQSTYLMLYIVLHHEIKSSLSEISFGASYITRALTFFITMGMGTKSFSGRSALIASS